MKRMKSFTLMETIMVIGLSALILSGLGAIFAGTIRLWSSIQNSTSALKEGMLSMQWITRDIMEGEIEKIGDGYIKLDVAEYSLNGTNLMRDLDLVANAVISLTFAYYNKDGMEESDISKINFVSILLTVEKGGHTLSLRNGANIRNYEAG